MQKYEQITDSYINGNRQEFKKWYFSLTKSQSIQFIVWLHSNYSYYGEIQKGDLFTDIINYLNN